MPRGAGCMIRAVKSKPFNRIFALYNHYYLLRRRFRSFTLSGSLDPLLPHTGSPIEPDQPVIYFMNHSSWWDGLLLYHASQQTSRGDHYVMMEEEQLRRYAFFRKLGAYSINKENASGIRTSLQYSTKLLHSGKGSGSFPKGKFCIRMPGQSSSVQALGCCYGALHTLWLYL